MRHLSKIFAAIGLLLGLHSLSWAEEPSAQTPSKERLELMYRVFSEFELHLAEETERSLPGTKKPILRWSNPVRNSFSDGATYLWLKDERPVAVATISIRGNGTVWREFTTLAEKTLEVTHDGKVVWKPEGGDLVLKPLKGVPTPASSARLRLSQMRKIAEQFRITMFESETNRDEYKSLRLLPQPVYQWSSKAPAVSQGAVFAFCEGTDPEAVLVLEAYAEKKSDTAVWRYSLARQTSRPLTFFHNDQEIGSVKGYWKNPRTQKDPYAELTLPQYRKAESSR